MRILLVEDHGLDMGADDYLVKPFDLEELSARIRVAVRRNVTHANSELVHSGISLTVVTKQVSHAVAVALTAREYHVLYALSCARPIASRGPRSKRRCTDGAMKWKATRSKCTSTTCAGNSAPTPSSPSAVSVTA